ncbi:MAG: hypothetical protein K9M57_09275 [Phycisphaerae bacterium]|nr:hypothetical protein [Phycisphaerae bacterium]
MKAILTTTICACSLLTGCDKDSTEKPAKKPTENPTRKVNVSTMKGNTFSNSYFNMEIECPDEWIVQSQEALDAQVEVGADIVAGDDADLKAEIKATDPQTRSLFTFARYENDSSAPFNPNIICISDNISDIPEIKNGEDYYLHFKQVLNVGRLEYRFPKEVYGQEFSGIKFDTLETDLPLGEMMVHQKYHTAKIKDYILMFVLSYETEAQEKALDDIVKTLRFAR